MQLFVIVELHSDRCKRTLLIFILLVLAYNLQVVCCNGHCHGGVGEHIGGDGGGISSGCGGVILLVVKVAVGVAVAFFKRIVLSFTLLAFCLYYHPQFLGDCIVVGVLCLVYNFCHFPSVAY